MKASATLSPPERPVSPDAAPPVERGALRPRPGVAERQRQYRRAVRWGIVGSVLLHLLVVRASPLFVRFAELVEGFAWSVPPPPPAQGVEVVLLREATREPLPRVVERRPAPAAETPAPSAPPSAGARAPTTAELLRPRVGDWRLVVPPPLPARERALTPEERTALLNRRLHALLAEANDSAAAAASREAAALDWTVGEEGSRWGISPGQIHLGEITLPLPFTLGPNPAQAREQAEKLGSYEEIQRQAGQASVDETFEDRVKAIRERREAERKKGKGGTPADTAEKKPS